MDVFFYEAFAEEACELKSCLPAHIKAGYTAKTIQENHDLLKKAKKGAVFVNVARGELSPTKDLLWLLDEGHLSGIGLDVYENESELAIRLRTGEVGPDHDLATLTLELRGAQQCDPDPAQCIQHP